MLLKVKRHLILVHAQFCTEMAELGFIGRALSVGEHVQLQPHTTGV